MDTHLPKRLLNPLWRAKNYLELQAGMPDPIKEQRLARERATTTAAVTTTRETTTRIGLGGGLMCTSGGTVTQATSKSTGVTLNASCGNITMNAAAMAANALVSFTLTNSTIAATDAIVVNHGSVGNFGAYHVQGRCGGGQAFIAVRNVSAGSLSEAIHLTFVVIKAVTS